MSELLLDRLAENMSVTDSGCFEWGGYDNGVGYGLVYADGKNRLVHRVAYEELVGPIPAGLVLDHLCRNPGCFNPDHVEPVTQRTNILRGTAPAARRAAQTHCVRGHEFDAHNTRFKKNGTRRCRKCAAFLQQRYRDERKAAA